MSGRGKSIQKNSPLAGVLELIRLDRGLRDALKADYLRIAERVRRDRELADCVRRLTRRTRIWDYVPFADMKTEGPAFDSIDVRRETMELIDMAFAAPEGPYEPQP